MRRTGRVIGGVGRAETRVDERAHREHILSAIFAIKVHYVAVEIYVTRKRRRNDFQPGHALDQRVVEQSAMLDTEARIAARIFPLDLFVNTEDFVDRKVSVGMGRELPSSSVGFAASLKQLVAGCDLQAFIVGDAYIRPREPCGALGDGTIGILFDATDA